MSTGYTERPKASTFVVGPGNMDIPGMDIPANGGYVVAPPSFHESGNRYEVIDDSLIVMAPEWLTELVGTKKNTNSSSGSGSDVMIVPEGQRDAVLTRLAGAMRRIGMCQDAIEAGLTQVNELQCDPPKPDAPTRISHSVARYQPSAPVTATTFNLTDTGNAELLVSLFGDRLRYDHKRCRWLIWNGNIWQPDIGTDISVGD